MEVYLVRGRMSFYDGYEEDVAVYKDMKETDKTFAKTGCRLLKDELYKTRRYINGYQMLVRNEEDIPQARFSIKNGIKEDATKSRDRADKVLQQLLDHSLTSEIEEKRGY